MARPRSSRPSRKSPPAPSPVRPGYDSLGTEGYYAAHAADYANPHEPIVRRLVESWVKRHSPATDARILDLACGSGEISSVFLSHGFEHVVGVDPYTGPAYLSRTGREALKEDFVSISRGALDSRNEIHLLLFRAPSGRFRIAAASLPEVDSGRACARHIDSAQTT